MVYYIFQGDPAASPPPDGNQALTVAKAIDDKEVYVLGSKMFGSSDVSIIGRTPQERFIGRVSNGRFGDTQRAPVSHVNTLAVSFNGVEIQDPVFENLDQFTQDAVADLVFDRRLIVSQDPNRANTGAYISDAVIRAL